MSRRVRKRIGETLVEAGLIDEFQLRSALADQKRWGNRLGKTLVKLGFVEEAPLMRHLSKVMGYPLAEIGGAEIDPEVRALIPADQAKKFRCMPLFIDGSGASRYLYVGMEEPADLNQLDALQLRTGMTVCPVLIGFGELDAALARYYGVGLDPPGRPEDDQGFEIGGPRQVGPDCLRHGDEALEADAEAEAPAPPAEASAAPTAESPAAPRAVAEATTAGPAAEKPDASDAGSPSVKMNEVPTRQILQALTLALMDKGVLTPDDLKARVRSLQGRDGG